GTIVPGLEISAFVGFFHGFTGFSGKGIVNRCTCSPADQRYQASRSFRGDISAKESPHPYYTIQNKILGGFFGARYGTGLQQLTLQGGLDHRIDAERFKVDVEHLVFLQRLIAVKAVKNGKSLREPVQLNRKRDRINAGKSDSRCKPTNPRR